eukprot:GILJ01006849.1.p1 GENE.GILJ01006849.1~~GILJ01006849.1.p1  ORF type:complete len:661 (+),score=111.21 GILJ01006849.1:98-2080(+)
MAHKGVVLSNNASFTEVFDPTVWAETFNGRCIDNGEPATSVGAAAFRDQILAQNAGKSKELRLRSCRLGINALIALAHMNAEREVSVIDLADNNIANYGLLAVRSLLTNTGCRYMDLSSNSISTEGANELAAEIISNPKLLGLELGNLSHGMKKNTVGTGGAVAFAEALTKNQTLNALSLCDNQVGPEGGEAIGAALMYNQSLHTLKLGSNPLGVAGVVPVLRNGSRLASLDLSNTRITSDVGQLICNLIRSNQRLILLHLGNNSLGLTGITALCQGLSSNHSLVQLNVSANHIGDEGCAVLSRALRGNNTLTHLNLSGNNIGYTGVQHLVHILDQTTISILHLSRNPLEDATAELFADYITRERERELFGSVPVSVLTLAACRIKDDGALALFDACRHSRYLRTLKLSNNFLSERLDSVVLNLLSQNSSLIDLNLSGTRISHVILSKIRKLCRRNAAELDRQEAKRLKQEIYRLVHNKDKLIQARAELTRVEAALRKTETEYSAVDDEMHVFTQVETVKKQQLFENIEEARIKQHDLKQRILDRRAELIAVESQVNQASQAMKDEYAEVVLERQRLMEQQDRFKSDYEKAVKYWPSAVAALKSELERARKEKREAQQVTESWRNQLRALNATPEGHVRDSSTVTVEHRRPFEFATPFKP